MYALQGNNFLAQTLESTNLTGYAKRLAHELVHQAVKADPTLLSVLESTSEYGSSNAKTTRDNPVARFARYKRSQNMKRNLDSHLHNVSMRFLTKIIRYLRNSKYEVVLAVYPHDAEERIIYGGTSREIYLGVWVNIRNVGYVFIAEGKTRNKGQIAVVIAATGAEHKTRIGEAENAFDVYTSPVEGTVEQKFQLWT
jgi:hypothetical protein